MDRSKTPQLTVKSPQKNISVIKLFTVKIRTERFLIPNVCYALFKVKIRKEERQFIQAVRPVARPPQTRDKLMT